MRIDLYTYIFRTNVRWLLRRPSQAACPSGDESSSAGGWGKSSVVVRAKKDERFSYPKEASLQSATH